jgi:hypothetical protein
MQELSQLHTIFARTKEAIGTFTDMLTPVMNNAEDEHTRLYYHHILEEEEKRLERLNELLPYLESLAKDNKADQLSNRELSHLLSDLNLERFGLHNFREHLELALYQFQDAESRGTLGDLREMTHSDYLTVKEIMSALSERFSDVVQPVKIADHDEGHDIHAVDHLKASESIERAQAPVEANTPSRFTPAKKGLTVGSLRNVSM